MHEAARGLAATGVGIVVAITAIALIAATHGPANDFTTVCQDADYVRLEDPVCERGDRGSFVMYVATNSNYHVPAVGGRLDQSRLVRTLPTGKTVQRAAIAKEGQVVNKSPHIIRGIFGGKLGSSGG